MPSEKFFVHKEDGSLVRLKGRLVRFLDEEPPTGSDKSAIRTALEVSPDAEGLVQADVGTDPNQLVLHQHLGDISYQSADSVSMGTVEITDKIDLSGAPTQQLEVYGDAPTVRVTDTSDGVGDGDSIGKLEFYGSDGSSGGVGVRAKIDTVSETAAGNQYGVAISTSTANSTPVERVRVDGQGRVGIGTASPDAQTEISKSSAGDILKISGGAQVRGLIFSSSTSAAGSAGAKHTLNAQSSNGEIAFAVAGAEKWKVDSSGNLVANSTGIDFGSGASTTIDSYEIGTFTPTAGGTWTSAPTSLSGSYVKIGDLVYAVITFGASSSKSSSTSGYLDGLPFDVNGSSVGSVSDVGVRDLGNCLAANVTRVWLTETSFPATATASVVYRTA